jgi:hypothetical protein
MLMLAHHIVVLGAPPRAGEVVDHLRHIGRSKTARRALRGEPSPMPFANWR